jgi:hypothetical protein
MRADSELSARSSEDVDIGALDIGVAEEGVCEGAFCARLSAGSRKMRWIRDGIGGIDSSMIVLQYLAFSVFCE